MVLSLKESFHKDKDSLNNEQAYVFNRILKDYKKVLGGKGTTLYKITGSAGTGKTFTTAMTLKWFLSLYPGKKVGIVTISHAALKNFTKSLRDVLPDLDYFVEKGRVELKTVASLLKQFPLPNGGFSKADNSGVGQYDLLIIDEYSNVGRSKALPIVQGLSKNAMVLWLGDPLQLPPVMDRKSEITTGTDSAYGLPMVSLEITQHMRNNGAISRLCDYTREVAYFPEKTIGEQEIIVHKNVGLLIDTMCQYIRKYGLENVCLYNYTNDACTKLGKRIRQSLYPNSKQDIENGETLVVSKGDSILRNGDIITCDVRKVSQFKLNPELKVYECYSPAHKGNIVVIHKDQKELYESEVKKIQERVKAGDDSWIDAFNWVSNWIVAGYTYSRTVHSIQGVTTPHTFINSPDLKKARGSRKNLLYVAYSRAKNTLHLVKVD